jgi:hypothetical protein
MAAIAIIRLKCGDGWTHQSLGGKWALEAHRDVGATVKDAAK